MSQEMENQKGVDRDAQKIQKSIIFNVFEIEEKTISNITLNKNCTLIPNSAFFY